MIVLNISRDYKVIKWSWKDTFAVHKLRTTSLCWWILDRLRSDNAPRNCTGALWGLSAETNANGACITLYKDGGDVISTFYLAFDSFIMF